VGFTHSGDEAPLVKGKKKEKKRKRNKRTACKYSSEVKGKENNSADRSGNKKTQHQTNKQKPAKLCKLHSSKLKRNANWKKRYR
jgi:hypothetical protein